MPGVGETGENSVTQIHPTEDDRLDKRLYMSRTADRRAVSIELTFAPGTPDIAGPVQNKLQLAMEQLPDVVKDTGVVVSKSTGTGDNRGPRLGKTQHGHGTSWITRNPTWRRSLPGPGVGEVEFSQPVRDAVWLTHSLLIIITLKTSLRA